MTSARDRAVRKADKTGDNDGVLEPGEVWSLHLHRRGLG